MRKFMQEKIAELKAEPVERDTAWLDENAEVIDLGKDPAGELWSQKFRQIGARTDGRSTVTYFMSGRINRWAWLVLLPLLLVAVPLALLFSLFMFTLVFVLGLVALLVGLIWPYKEAWVVHADEQGVKTYSRKKRFF